MSKICRTCLKTIKGEYEFINTDVPAYNLDITSTCNKLQNCIPELDLTLVPGPVICTDCITALNVAYKFKKQCLETDEDIRAYLQNPDYSCDPTKLLELVQENKETKDVIIKTKHIECVMVVEQPVGESHAVCDDQNEDINPFINMEIEDGANNTSNESYFQEIDQQNLLDIQAVEYDYHNPSDHFIDIENKFKCDICSLGFRQRQELIKHKRTHVFKCNVCGIVTKTKGGLMTHIKSHTDKKKFSCESCTYSSNNKIAFMTHSIVHTGIKPFPCNQCDRRFVSYVSAEKHIKKCHRPVYKCPTCDYSTTNSYSLKAHIKIHTAGGPFSCTKCDYQGSTMELLQVHVTIHDHECHLCKFKTRDEFNLLNHLVYCVHKNKPKPENTIEKKEVDDGCPEHVPADSDSTNKCEKMSDAQIEVETNNIYSKETSDDDKTRTDSDLNSTHMEKEVGNNSYNKETSVDGNMDYNTMKKCDEFDLNTIQMQKEIISETINKATAKEANTDSNNSFKKCEEEHSSSDLNVIQID